MSEVYASVTAPYKCRHLTLPLSMEPFTGGTEEEAVEGLWALAREQGDMERMEGLLRSGKIEPFTCWNGLAELKAAAQDAKCLCILHRALDFVELLHKYGSSEHVAHYLTTVLPLKIAHAGLEDANLLYAAHNEQTPMQRLEAFAQTMPSLEAPLSEARELLRQTEEGRHTLTGQIRSLLYGMYHLGPFCMQNTEPGDNAEERGDCYRYVLGRGPHFTLLADVPKEECWVRFHVQVPVGSPYYNQPINAGPEARRRAGLMDERVTFKTVHGLMSYLNGASFRQHGWLYVFGGL